MSSEKRGSSYPSMLQKLADQSFFGSITPTYNDHDVINTIRWGFTHSGSISVQITIDDGSNGGELGQEIHAVLIGVLPIRSLRHSSRVSSCELALVIEGSDCSHKLSHRMKILRENVEETDNVGGKSRTSIPFLKGWGLR